MIRNTEKLLEILSTLKSRKENNVNADDSILFDRTRIQTAVGWKGNVPGPVKFVWDEDFLNECKRHYSTEPTVILPCSRNQHQEVYSLIKAGTLVTGFSKSMPHEVLPDRDDDGSSVEFLKTKLLSKVWMESEEDQKAVIALTDNQFEHLLEPPFVEKLPMKISEKLCYVLGKGYETSRRKKLVILGSKVLMSKISSGIPIRDVIQSLKYMAAADSSVATEFVFFPMLKRQMTIPRPLLSILDKDLLLDLFLSWMVAESIEFSEHTIQLCTTLFENRKSIEGKIISLLFIVFRNSFQSKSEDKSLAHFFRFCVDTYGWQLQQATLQQLLAINDLNRTSNNDDVKHILESKLNLLAPSK